MQIQCRPVVHMKMNILENVKKQFLIKNTLTLRCIGVFMKYWEPLLIRTEFHALLNNRIFNFRFVYEKNTCEGIADKIKTEQHDFLLYSERFHSLNFTWVHLINIWDETAMAFWEF